jgi:hypothetical protein
MGGLATIRALACCILALVSIAAALAAAPSDIDITGAYKTSGTTRISSTGVGTFATGTTINSLGVCQADGTNCPLSGSSSGWKNGTTLVYLANNATNVSVGYVSSAPVLFVDNTNGRVSVGTTSPNQKLHIVGVTNITEGIIVGETPPLALVGYNSSITGFSNTTGGAAGFVTAVAIAPTLEFDASGTIGINFRPDVQPRQNLATVRGAAIVPRIRTSSNGSNNITTNFNALFVRIDASGYSGNVTGSRIIELGNPSGFNTGGVQNVTALYIANIIAGSVDNYAVYADGTTKSYFGGNVGIGTVSPTSALHVNGNLSVSGTTNSSIDGSTFAVDSTGHRVGIGVAAPSAKLFVNGSVAGDPVMRIQSSSATGYSGIAYWDNGGSEDAFVGVDNAQSVLRINSVNNQPIVLMTNSIEKMRITTPGNVNITQGNLSIQTNYSMCFNPSCSARIYHNGTALVIEG